MEMKYVKPFELFESNSQIFEAEGIADVESKIKALPADQKEALKGELESFAKKLGLTTEDLGDPLKVANAMAANKNVVKALAESEFTPDEEALFEGAWQKFTAWAKAKKQKLAEWMVKVGGLSILGGMITAGVGAEMDAGKEMMLRAGESLDPNSFVVIGGIAFLIGVAAVTIGLAKSGNLKKVAAAAAAARNISR